MDIELVVIALLIAVVAAIFIRYFCVEYVGEDDVYEYLSYNVGKTAEEIMTILQKERPLRFPKLYLTTGRVPLILESLERRGSVISSLDIDSNCLIGSQIRKKKFKARR